MVDLSTTLNHEAAAARERSIRLLQADLRSRLNLWDGGHPAPQPAAAAAAARPAPAQSPARSLGEWPSPYRPHPAPPDVQLPAQHC